MNEADALVSSALRTAAPRVAFSDQLLHALKNSPPVLIPVDDFRADRVRKLVLTGSFAGAVGLAGAAVYTMAKRSRRREES